MKIVVALEQKREPTLPISLALIQYVFERNKSFMKNKSTLSVTDGTGKKVDVQYQDAEKLVQTTAEIFDSQLKVRFPELSGHVPVCVSAAAVADPRQKGIDLDASVLEEAKQAIVERLEKLIAYTSFAPLKPFEESSEDDDTHVEWDIAEEADKGSEVQEALAAHPAEENG